MEKIIPKMVGRPRKYTNELGILICKIVSISTCGLRKICKSREDFPHPDTIREWRFEYPEFSALYAQAKIIQADILSEECLDIADDDSQDIRVNEEGYETFNGEFAARSRIRIDTRKWLASKLLPKQYGDKFILDQKTEENEKLREEIRLLRSKLDEEYRKDY
jgi:hypothetical protein